MERRQANFVRSGVTTGTRWPAGTCEHDNKKLVVDTAPSVLVAVHSIAATSLN